MPRPTQKKPVRWWNFTGASEAFEARDPDRFSRLYFPLCNEAGLLSAITPTLHGDIKTGQNQFLTLPLSVEDLHNTRSARNFWIYVEGRGPWSAAGSSAVAVLSRASAKRAESCQLEAGALWHRVTRENRTLGLRSTITNFIPAGPEQVEVMQVAITNTGRKPIAMTPTAAIPIFGRSADNLRDHRHVTSLLHRIHLHANGVLVTPTMSFDERGHQLNSVVYAVLGCEADGTAPVGTFPTVASFVGEGGSFDAPRAVYDDLDVPELEEVERQGREAVGALRFRSRKLAPGRTATYLVFMGIAKERKDAIAWTKTYGSLEKVEEALADSQQFWKERLDRVQIHTDHKDFDRWTRWVEIQPILRKIFGCSFLPDFDYGRGGRGWRDLWQDCLALLLLDEGDPWSLLLNNFAGIRMNGSNATIIGKAAGEFIADRNNISRTWMDHGVWPWLTTELYIHQSGDWKFLFEEVPYFWDQDKGETTGTVLEHLLVQHLTSYFNRGEHGNLRLEDADWNDGLDMASDRGESVAFSSVYAGNLIRLGEMLESVAKDHQMGTVRLAEELDILVSAQASDISPQTAHDRLAKFRGQTKVGVSGRKKDHSTKALAEKLKSFGQELSQHIRTKEWIKTSSGHAWFNGYYDNNAERVEGNFEGTVRMTLTGQVFPIMAGVATNEQVQQSYAAAKKFLQDKNLGGYRLNTDFGALAPPLGRALAFAYGEKENGAFFSHMIVMFANALYQRGFVDEGHEVLLSLYRMCMNADAAKIYPCLPEYFNGEGRGLYLYLTGSASWFMLTLVTEVLGIRGRWGNLHLAPKLTPDQFGSSGQVSAEVGFAGKRLKVVYMNRGKRPYGQYRVESVLLQGRSLQIDKNASNDVLIPRSNLTQIASPLVEITVNLA